MWDRIAALVTHRRSWLVALVILAAAAALMALGGHNSEATASPELLPGSTESAAVAAAQHGFPDGDQAATAILVATRTDGLTLTPADLAAVARARDRMRELPPVLAGPSAPVVVSADGKAAIAAVPLSNLSGFELTDAVKALRTAATDGLPAALSTHVTGGPAFGADIADAFTGANVTLLAVTASVVALLLIVTYRSPVLWLVPLLVIAFADRVATVVGTAVASPTGLTLRRLHLRDHQRAGVRGGHQLRAAVDFPLPRRTARHPEHRDALRRAVRRAGPGDPGQQRHRGAGAVDPALASPPARAVWASGGAAGWWSPRCSVLVVLPPLLALCGRTVVLAVHPRAPTPPTTLDSGPWHRVAERVARRPATGLQRSRSPLWRPLPPGCWGPGSA